MNSSKRPISIRIADHHFPRAGISEKLLAGPKSPSAGPTFPRLDAATPMADSKPNPNRANPKAPTIKEIIYKIKKPNILKQFLKNYKKMVLRAAMVLSVTKKFFEYVKWDVKITTILQNSTTFTITL